MTVAHRTAPLTDLCALALWPTAGDSHEGKRSKKFIGRYHHLDYRMRVGTGMRGVIPECDGADTAMLARPN